MNTVDLDTLEAHLREIPRGLRYFDVHWIVAETINTHEEWARIQTLLLGGMIALGVSHPDYGDYRTLFMLADARLCAIAEPIANTTGDAQ